MKLNLSLLFSLAFSSFFLLPYFVLAQFKNTTPEASGSLSLPGGFAPGGILGNFLLVVLGAIGVFSLIGFITAAIFWVTAAASEDRLAMASSTFVYSLIGIILSIGGIFLFSYFRGYLGI